MENCCKTDRGALAGERLIRIFLLLTAVCLSVKYIFVDFGLDAEFQISMSYRFVRGDLMLREMWEPHQTSTFLTAFFIKLYLSLFKTTTGIVLYLQIIGVLIDWAVAYLLYRTADKYLECRGAALAMAWFFVVVSPKDVPLPEFANMQIWFSALLCLALFAYHRTEQKKYLVLAGLSLCAAVLSYPSCLILAAGVAFLLFFRGKNLSHSKKVSRNWPKEFLLFISVCAAAGAVYLSLIMRHISPKEFSVILKNILALEPTHSVDYGLRLARHLLDAARLAAVLAAAYGVSLVLSAAAVRIFRRIFRIEDIRGKKELPGNVCGMLTDFLFFMIILSVSLYAVFSWETFTRYGYSISFFAVILLGARHAKTLPADKKFFYLCGMVISGLNFFATLLLSDLQLIGAVPYLIIAAAFSFIPIEEALRQANASGSLTRRLRKAALICGMAFLVFRNVYLIRPMIFQGNTLLQVGGIVKEGPAIGIISNYMGAYIQNETIKEWREYIKEGSRIYLIGDPLDTLGYLYLDTDIAAPSVQCTPWYNESILEYWKMNPDKYPDVVIASCWYGDMNASLVKNGWILEWIEKDLQPSYSIDGKYWRYYFR